MKKWLQIRLFSEKLIVAFLLTLSAPMTVGAATFSSILADMIRGTAETTDASVENHTLSSLPLLQAARNTDPNPARGDGGITIVGGSALLAETGPSGSMANIKDVPASDQISIYVVRPGDTLSVVAKLFGVSPNTIVWANDLPRGGALTVGQTLVILPISGIQHTVVKGETIQSIAKKYGGDVDEIMSYNDLAKGSALAVGDVIIIPDGENPTVTAPKSSTKTTSPIRNAGGPNYSGYYARPIAGARETQTLHGNNGVDLAAPYGTQVTAAAGGTVIVARNSGWNGGYGEYVVISHPNGTQTLYAHLSGVIVFVGQTVVKGQVIGYEGQTGKATGPHLHFEVRGAKNPFGYSY